MNPLSQLLNADLIARLKSKCESGFFPKIDFETAMKFALTDGILPANGLPAQSFLKLEAWLRSEDTNTELCYSATDLKNKTGEIIEQVLRGKTIVLQKHGRRIAQIRPL